MRFIISATGEGKNTIHCYSDLNIAKFPKTKLTGTHKDSCRNYDLAKTNNCLILLNKKVHF